MPVHKEVKTGTETELTCKVEKAEAGRFSFVWTDKVRIFLYRFRKKINHREGSLPISVFIIFAMSHILFSRYQNSAVISNDVSTALSSKLRIVYHEDTQFICKVKDENGNTGDTNVNLDVFGKVFNFFK